MNIALQGKPCAKIILPSRPTPVEEHAARELQKYIQMISGAVLSIGFDSESAQGARILIGGPERNAAAAEVIGCEEFDRLVPGPEGMMIRSFEKDVLLLAGSSKQPNEHERGTLYAVYELLERYWGCSFAAYGCPGSTIGEWIPQNNDLCLEAVSYVKAKADLEYRTAIIQYDAFEVNSLPSHKLTVSLLDWMAKNRLNRAMLMLTTYEALKKNGYYEEIVRRGINMTVGHHDASMFFLPPDGNEVFAEAYYQTHPEYYRLEADGNRFHPDTKWHGQLIFDMHSQGCIQQLADNMNTWLAANPYVDIVSFWPNDDVAPQCCCLECAPHSKTSNYAHMCNEVAKKVQERHPHIKVDLLVYQDLWNPPSDIALCSGVLVDVATWGPNMIRRFGCKDGSGLIGSETEAVAKAWGTHGENLVYYDYYMTNFGSNQVYCPMADEIVKIYEHFYEIGYCKGSGTQMEAYNLWNYLFNFYVHGRKAYNIRLGFPELLDAFVKIFGAGAAAIKKYLVYVEDFSDGQAPNGNESAAYFAKHVDKEKVYAFFEEAYLAQKQDGPEKDSIRLLRMAFRYSDLMINHPDNDELIYISEHFGSYWGELGQVGYGISTYVKPGESSFAPDKWYSFACSPR